MVRVGDPAVHDHLISRRAFLGGPLAVPVPLARRRGRAAHAATATGKGAAMPVGIVNGATFNPGGPVIRGAPQYYSSGSSGVGSTFAVAKDAGVQPGDMILVFLTWNGTGTNPAITGFTAYPKTASVFGIALFSRVADGTEGATFTVSFASGFNVAAVCVAYQQTNGVLDPVPAASGQITLATTAIQGPGVTTTAPADMMIWFGAARANGAGAPTPVITAPPGLNAEGGGASTTATASANVAVLLADILAQPAGATGDQDGTSSLSADVGGVLLTLQAVSAAASVTAGLAAGSGSAKNATTGSNVNATAGLAAASGAAQAILSGLGTVVGSYINETVYPGSLTHAQAITAWQASTARTMASERIYHGAGSLPSSFSGSNDGAALAAGRVLVPSFKPFLSSGFYTFVQGSSPMSSATAQSSLDTSFNTCMAALVSAGANGSNCIIPLWHEPIVTQGITSSADYIAMFRHYAPLIQAHGSPPLQTSFCTSAGSVHNNNENSYYPGDAYCDVVATDYYATAYDSGFRLGLGGSTDPAQHADLASPPKPFGLFEMFSSEDASVGQTQTQADNYWAYVLAYFAGRLHGNQPCAPILCFNSTTNLSQETPIIVADGVAGYGGPVEYRNALYQALYDGVQAVT